MTNIFLSILGISVSIGWMVIILMILTPFLNKRYAAKWKYLIWIFLAVRLLVPVSGVSEQILIDMLSLAKTQTVAEPEEKYADIPADVTIPSRRMIVEIPAQMTTPITVQSGTNQMGITMLDLVVMVWMTGSLIFLSIHFISYSHYKRQVMKKGRMIEDVSVLNRMSELKRELHIRRTIQAIEYEEAESPMIIGFLKPVLVLPKEQYSSGELFFILKHELVHFKRGDVYLKLLFVTANAVHWFNPFIWMMLKEAVIDMELSCDERVVQGTSYAVRKAYTETLLSMLHKRCARRTVLSTQFYGGTKIMKKRFKNILLKNGKKNGIFLLVCAVAATISVGTLAGCSITKKEIGKEVTGKKDIGNEHTDQVPGRSEEKAIQTEQMTAGNDSADNPILENAAMLTFTKEGEQEQKQAVLAAGDGYSIYLPKNEWQPSGPDLWMASANEQVRLWITHFEDERMNSVDQDLEDNGYVTVQNGHKRKQEGDLIYHVVLKAHGHDVWGIFYSYPAESEEGWGRELPVIADTFALSRGTDDVKSDSTDPVSEYLGAFDCQEIRNIVDEFAAAYFDGNADVIQKFLASTYEGEIDTYEGTGVVSDLTLKGLSDADEKKMEYGRYVVSLQFRDSNYEDMFLYLTCVLIKQEDSWKIQFYGVEG